VASLDWMEDAACLGMDPRLFFPDTPEDTLRARRVCGGCEVAAQCMEHAQRTGATEGIWGGLSSGQRRPPLTDPTDTGACGTYPTGYNRHRTARERVCEECRMAMKRARLERLAAAVAAVDADPANPGEAAESAESEGRS
jgi:Transcription factor WhiB